MTNANERVTSAKAKELFYEAASQAIEAGLLTPGERDTISRRHTRKAGYWRRHLRNLHEWVWYRAFGPPAVTIDLQEMRERHEREGTGQLDLDV